MNNNNNDDNKLTSPKYFPLMYFSNLEEEKREFWMSLNNGEEVLYAIFQRNESRLCIDWG